MPQRPISVTIGSRGSDLALWQAKHVTALLKSNYPELEVKLEIIHTMGDRVLDSSLALIGGKGVFTKEIEAALIDRRIDIAVHSLKDLPTIMEPGLHIAAVPERAPVEDAFLARDPCATLASLPEGATIATGSIRRKAQILAKRPDLKVIDIRGNVPTRIQKLVDSEWDGMILATAGVERLGLFEYVRHRISTEWVLPAVGQGALGIQTRANDAATIELLRPLNDIPTLTSVAAERALLRAMGGGCQVPIGAHGRLVDGKLLLEGCVAHPDGTSVLRGSVEGDPDDAEAMGLKLANELLDQGGREILELVFRLQTEATQVEAHPQS